MGKIQEIELISISDGGFGLSVEPGEDCPLNQLIDRSAPESVLEIERELNLKNTYNSIELKFYCKLLFGDKIGGVCPFYCDCLYSRGPAGTDHILCNF